MTLDFKRGRSSALKQKLTVQCDASNSGFMSNKTMYAFSIFMDKRKILKSSFPHMFLTPAQLTSWI